MSAPAHKNTKNPPGQIKNPLGRLDEGKRKLTFDEWAEESQIIYRKPETRQDLYDMIQDTWKAAQENME